MTKIHSNAVCCCESVGALEGLEGSASRPLSTASGAEHRDIERSNRSNTGVCGEGEVRLLLHVQVHGRVLQQQVVMSIRPCKQWKVMRRFC